MKSKLIQWSFVLVMVFILILPQSAFAYNAFKETSTGIPTLTTPLFVPNTLAPVTSSWNEPRTGTDSPHKGVDQGVGSSSGGVDVGPMWLSGSGTIIETGYSGNCGGGNYQVIKYVNGGTTFYTIFFHLSSYLKTSGTVYGSDHTAVTGATGTTLCGTGGTASPAAYHIHFEILSYYNEGQADRLSSRVSVNPANYVSMSNSNNFTVYKNWAVTGSNPTRAISIDAIDYNLGSAQHLSDVRLYYKVNGTTTWTSTSMTESPANSGHYTSTIYVGSTGTVYNALIVGRRASPEYWVTFPAFGRSCEHFKLMRNCNKHSESSRLSALLSC
jgi:hypothetical protein